MLDTDCLYHLSQLVGALASQRPAETESVAPERRLEVVRALEAKVLNGSLARELLLATPETADSATDGLSTQGSSDVALDLRSTVFSNPLFNFCLDQLVREREVWRRGEAVPLSADEEDERLLLKVTTDSLSTPQMRWRAPAAGAECRTNMDAVDRKLRRENLQLQKELKAKSVICHDLRTQLNQTHQIFDHLLTALDDESDSVPGLLVALVKGEVLFTSVIKKVVEKVILLKCEARDLKRKSSRPALPRQQSEYGGGSRRRFRASEFAAAPFFLEKELQTPEGNEEAAAPYAVDHRPAEPPHHHCLEANENEAFMRGYLGLGREPEPEPWTPSKHARGDSVAAQHYRSATALYSRTPLSVAPPPPSETARAAKKGSTKILHAISKFLNGGGGSSSSHQHVRKNHSFIV